VELPDPGAGADRAVGLGALPIGPRSEHREWRTLQSPGGLPFCLLATREHEAPEPITAPDGHRTRMVQVCIDSPGAVHEREVAFWRALLSGRWAGSGRPEFAGKWHDDAGSPVQLLFQRLDEPSGRVRAHLDLGTDDVPAEVERVLALGAHDVGPGPGGWHVLRDPVGMPFCVTANSPELLAHRDLG
jgi:hypothetical protein